MQSELRIISSSASWGSGWHQYSSGLANAALMAAGDMRLWSVERI